MERGPGRTAVVLGGTGLVGAQVVDLLAGDPHVRRVVAPVRREVRLWADRPTVDAPVVDFDDLEAHAGVFRCEQIFVCLGTTMRKAGSREAFRRVDLEYVVASARLAAQAGARHALLVTAAGANPSSRVFYSRLKGEAEEALRALPFLSVHVFRPSILTGERREARPLERLAIVVARVAAPLMLGPLRRYRPIATETVARAMVSMARDPRQGFHAYESEEVAELGRVA